MIISPIMLACAAAGLACKSIVLSFFLVFCAACVLDVKTKTFAENAAVTCLTSGISQLVPYMQYASVPLGFLAFLVSRTERPVKKPPTREESPTPCLHDLL